MRVAVLSAFEPAGKLAGAFHQIRFVLQQGEHRTFNRRQIMVQAEERPRFFTFHRFLTIGITQEGQQRAVGTGRWFNHIRQVLLIARLVKVAQVLFAKVHVLLQVKVRSVGDALKLTPADGEFIFHVYAALGVMRNFI